MTAEHLHEEVRRLRAALGLARSMLLCGESMSPEAQAQIESALRNEDPGTTHDWLENE